MVSLTKTQTVTRFAETRLFSGFDSHPMRIELSGNYVRHTPDTARVDPMTPEAAYNLNQRKPLVFL